MVEKGGVVTFKINEEELNKVYCMTTTGQEAQRGEGGKGNREMRSTSSKINK